MGKIYSGVIFMVIATSMIIGGSQPHGELALIFIGMIGNLIGLAFLLIGLKDFFIKDIIDELKKIAPQKSNEIDAAKTK